MDEFWHHGRRYLLGRCFLLSFSWNRWQNDSNMECFAVYRKAIRYGPVPATSSLPYRSGDQLYLFRGDRSCWVAFQNCWVVHHQVRRCLRSPQNGQALFEGSCSLSVRPFGGSKKNFSESLASLFAKKASPLVKPYLSLRVWLRHYSMSKQHGVSALLVDAVVVLSAWCYVLLVHSEEDDILWGTSTGRCREHGVQERAAVWFWAALFQWEPRIIGKIRRDVCRGSLLLMTSEKKIDRIIILYFHRESPNLCLALSFGVMFALYWHIALETWGDFGK